MDELRDFVIGLRIDDKDVPFLSSGHAACDDLEFQGLQMEKAFLKALPELKAVRDAAHPPDPLREKH